MSVLRMQMEPVIKKLQEQIDMLDERAIKGDMSAVAKREGLIGAITEIKTRILDEEALERTAMRADIENAMSEDLNLYYWEDQVVSAVQEVRDDAADDAISSVTYYLESECDWTEDKIDHYRDEIEDMVNDYVNMHLRDAIDSNVL